MFFRSNKAYQLEFKLKKKYLDLEICRKRKKTYFAPLCLNLVDEAVFHRRASDCLRSRMYSQGYCQRHPAWMELVSRTSGSPIRLPSNSNWDKHPLRPPSWPTDAAWAAVTPSNRKFWRISVRFCSEICYMEFSIYLFCDLSMTVLS